MKLYSTILVNIILVTNLTATNISESKRNCECYMDTDTVRYLIDNASDDIKGLVKEIKEHKNDLLQAGGRCLPVIVSLVGQKGTDKAVLAKAIAQESNIPFIFVDWSLLCDKYQEYADSKLLQCIDEVHSKSDGFAIVILDMPEVSINEYGETACHMLANSINRTVDKNNVLFIITANSVDKILASLRGNLGHMTIRLDSPVTVNSHKIVKKITRSYVDLVAAEYAQ